jgi:hypothetical protein
MASTNVTLQVGQVARGVIQPTQNGNPIPWPGGTPVWTTDNPAVVLLQPDPTGMQCDIIAMQAGTALVTATGNFIDQGAQGAQGAQSGPITLNSEVYVTVTSPYPAPDSLTISANIKPTPPTPSQP